MLRWVFLDLGGVLLDEREYHAFMFREVKELLAGRGFETSEAQFMAGVRAVVSGASPSFGYDLPFYFLKDRHEAEAVNAVFEERVHGMDTTLNRVRPEALDVVEGLHDEYSLGVVANQRRSMARLLQEEGFSPYLDFIVISQIEGVAKPDPAIYELALERAGCVPGEAVMVGDRVDNDVVPAKAAGLWTIRMIDGTWASQTSSRADETPDWEIGRLVDLPQAVRELALRP